MIEKVESKERRKQRQGSGTGTGTGVKKKKKKGKDKKVERREEKKERRKREKQSEKRKTGEGQSLGYGRTIAVSMYAVGLTDGVNMHCLFFLFFFSCQPFSIPFTPSPHRNTCHGTFSTSLPAWCLSPGALFMFVFPPTPLVSL